MNERKILLFVLSVIFYCFYSVQMWFTTTNVNEEKPLSSNVNTDKPEVNGNKSNISQPNVVKPKVIPLFLKDACSALEVFTQKPQTVKIKRSKFKDMDLQNNTITVIGITVFLVILVLNALFDVLKVKEEERARRRLNPDGERRQSLAEFANKKMLRRESSKFSLHLFQIAESEATPSEEKKSPRESRPYTRAESINSYLGEKNMTKNSAPASIGVTPVEHKLVKRESVSKLIDNKLQWLPQRPVYNYHHCEFRFWRNRSLSTIPYSLWYHMFRGQQTRSLNIGCFGNSICNDSKYNDTLLLQLRQINNESNRREIHFPRKFEHILDRNIITTPSLVELCKRKFYQMLDSASKRLTTSPTISVYSDVNYDENLENNNNINNLQEHFEEFNLKNGLCSKKDINEEYYEKCKGDTKVDKLFIKAKMKGYCVPSDIVEEHFYYLPKFLKDDLCNGPISRCENVDCKKPLFDFVYFEFCLEKIILIENTEDVLINAEFCSKSCAEKWKTGKALLTWEFTFTK
ncbi:uncharacterized protein LOC123872865 isoform X2 [Maniola jurtina]|uniref:uncharacterized protein LOC123872865 isoform X2 n=1 Tax=Maniola jurtina TaxID=191418 RepID=UPI001E687A75|nr:uncharacterized protein LOC123872865 isoform X2 [Maniola jurtina]